MTEKWVFIEGYGDKYMLFQDGTVVSVRTGKPMSTDLNSKGYPRVLLFGAEGKKRKLVHRLVATHYVDNPNGHTIVLHKDDNPLNTHYTNLAWGTQKDNIRDIINKKRGIIGELNGRAKLRADDVAIIKEALDHGFAIKQIAAYYKVSTSTIYRIKIGTSWSTCGTFFQS